MPATAIFTSTSPSRGGSRVISSISQSLPIPAHDSALAFHASPQSTAPLNVSCEVRIPPTRGVAAKIDVLDL